MKPLLRVWLAFRIAFLEARIQILRRELGEGAAVLDRARRTVNRLHQDFAALDGRYAPSVHQLRRRS